MQNCTHSRRSRKNWIDSLEPRQLMAAVSANLDATKTYQTIDALGAASIAWTQQPEQMQGSFYDGLVNDLGASGVRSAIQPNFEVNNDNNDPNVFDWTKFDSKQLAHVMQFDQRMSERGVKQFFATVWTPPGWLKTNRADTGGGSLRADMRAEFAEYLAAVVIASKRDFGIELAGVSIQNEPFFGARFESAMYDNIGMRETLIAVQKKFKREGLATKVIVNEDLTTTDPSRWLWFNQAILDDDEVDRSKLIVSAHWSDPNSMAAQAAQLAGTGVPLWYTEVSGKEGTWDGGIRTARDISDTFTRAGASAYYYWTYNNYGTTPPLEQQTPSIMYNGVPNRKYDALKHFYKYVRPGMQRIQTTVDESSGMRLAAFKDPKNGATTIVLTNVNQGSDNTVTINLKGLGAGTVDFRGWKSAQNYSWQSMTPVNGTGNTMTITVPAYGMITLYNGPDIAVQSGGDSTPKQIYYNVDSITTNALRAAINDNNVGQVNSLINGGANVNAADAISGWTPLHTAAASIWPDAGNMLNLLISKGANVNAKDADGFTPLHSVAMNQWVWYGIDAQMKSNIAASLVAAGADINARDNQGRTPLMWAALAPANMDYNTYNTNLPTKLLALGADRLLKDNAGKTAYDYATAEYKPAFAAILGGSNTDASSPVARFVEYSRDFNRISLVITENVDNSLDTPDLKIVNRATNAPVTISSFTDTFANGLTVARASFANRLPDGHYRLTVAAGAFADPNGKLSAAITYDFDVMAGDANGDSKVDFADLVIVSQNYGTQTGRTFSQGDFDGDGTVDFDDLVLLSQRYGTSLPTLPAARRPV
jgi:O-glycosyl hydrolase